MTTFKQTVRTMQSAQRQYQRESARRQRELERQRVASDKAAAAEAAALEVALFENELELLTSLHLDCSVSIHWPDHLEPARPDAPVRATSREDEAQRALDSWKPSRMLKKRGDQMRRDLELSLAAAIEQDEADHIEALAQHRAMLEEVEQMEALAMRVLAGDISAYKEVLSEAAEFSEIEGLGRRISITVLSAGVAAVELDAQSDQIIPMETKSLLTTGKVSVKQMPVSHRWAYYQDHVCSAAIRVARDIFGLIPVEMVVVTVFDRLLDRSTGYKKREAILSVAFNRETLEGLNIAAIDSSDSLGNFVHEMDFAKTKGFRMIQPIEPSRFVEPTSS